ncbi:MAG: phytoene/squalene synthase family protein [Alphaproteobacteria bacterium HGW-Alphaproteobacteria-12]|nr:MAG: phytoene/squalene synthase family protein [Alphaproteobacteria bacterium HGW-Alphaproteobacteria-12]
MATKSRTSGLSESMRLCLDEVRMHDHDRFLTLLFAPAGKRPALIALYAFNLEIARIAETVSEPMMGHIRLQWWRETLEGLPRGETRGHAAAVALHEADAFPAGALAGLADARERDLSEDVFEDMSALESYAEATSSSVMRLAAQAIDEEKAEAAGEAIRHAGIAYALTGLLRALPLHASQGWLMLPADLLLERNVDPHDVLAGRMNEALRGAILDVASRARAHLTSARAASYNAALLPALLPASLCDRYLDLVMAPGFDPFKTPVEVPAFRRQLRLMGRSIAKRI